MKFKTLMAIGLIAMSAVVSAEDAKPSFWGKVGSILSASAEVTADAEALKDESIASIDQQIKELKKKYEAVKSSSSEEAESLKKKIDELTESLKKKYEDFKVEQKKKYEEAKAKREADRKSATNRVGIVRGIFGLFE